jgi:predicted PurR-regulated permease PerM
MKASGTERAVVRIELSPGSIGLVLAALAGVWLVRQLWTVVLLLVVALVFAGTFHPMVEQLRRRGLGRGAALLALLAGTLVTPAGLAFLSVPPLVHQLTELVRAAPQRREQLIALLERRSLTTPLAHLVKSAGLEQLFAGFESGLLGYSSQALLALGYFSTTLVLAFYLLADGQRTQGALYALVPRGYHMRLARIIDNLELIVGGYMRGQLITSAAIGLFTLALLAACRVPNALSIALFAALADVIPFVGGLLAAGVAGLAALSRGSPTAAIVLCALLVYMELESRVLVPRIYGRVLRLSPITVIVALLAGGTLLGMVGALLALPVAAALQMMLLELRVELPGDDSDDRTERARNAKTEALYERRSAGATAPEAGRIARDLAHDIRDADAAEAARAAKVAKAVAASTGSEGTSP